MSFREPVTEAEQQPSLFDTLIRPSCVRTSRVASVGRVPESAGIARQPLVVAGLFAGIGGIEHGLSRSGHRANLLCELDDAAREVLDNRFPTIEKRSDVTKLEVLPEETTLLTAGFPCQDLSQAGKRKGISGARSGLVGEVFRLVEQHRPPWVLVENVPFMLQLAKGEAMELVVSEFERLRYKWAYRVVDARAFGLPQRRRRVYMLASRSEDPRTVLFADYVDAPPEPPMDGWQEVACGFYWTEGNRGLGWARNAVPPLKGGSTVGIPSSPAIVMPDGRIVTPDIRDAERLQGFDADWTKAAESGRRHGFRWKLVGNAVSVNAAAWIGERLLAPGTFDDTDAVPLPAGKPWPTAAWNVDGERMRTKSLSEWPKHVPCKPLAEFLEYPTKPLSLRAASGFRSRIEASTLNFPPGFEEVVRRYCAAKERES